MTTSETPATASSSGKAAGPARIVVQYGEVRDIPLNRLKASPKNVRRVGHSAEVIASRAASITYKGVLQPLVVEPEVKDGKETGYYLVSAGEGRRQALRLLAKRKALARGAPVRCVVSVLSDLGPHFAIPHLRDRRRVGIFERRDASTLPRGRGGGSAGCVALRRGQAPALQGGWRSGAPGQHDPGGVH
ncbi:ParB/Srx family N-terminal domain-containing protein [Caulobacter zeae]|uniref:ParB/Srx family N-terminal domain-containing protein n=1 Tax=Caulobacter zeae TaxID=2055137 RepID=UPI001F0BF7A8|nr:ParB/Srx family N-terminal domain-containing protein [Caulobacter zeae]